MPTENETLIKSFLTYLRFENGLDPKTIASYENDLTKFARWFGRPLGEANRTDMQTFLSDSFGEGLSARTVGRRLAALRHFYRFLIDEGDVQVDPTRNLPVPKMPKTLPKSLTRAEVDTIVSSFGSSWIDVRDKAMVLTFYASGLRESELANLKLADLDLEAGVAKVWSGKGGKDGIVPLSLSAVSIIREYLESVRPKLLAENGVGDDAGHVFVSRYGRGMIRQAIYYRVTKIAKEALAKHASPHSLRHGFATSLIEGGADVRDVQALMRHSSVDTTQIYLHTDLNYLRKVYYATHPRARLPQVHDREISDLSTGAESQPEYDPSVSS